MEIISVENGEDTITISWVDHPFTTNITYCVDVIQILRLNETTLLVLSVCGLTGTAFSYISPGHDHCDRFNFTVIPTDGVDNGTSSEPVTGYFTQTTETTTPRIEASTSTIQTTKDSFKLVVGSTVGEISCLCINIASSI